MSTYMYICVNTHVSHICIYIYMYPTCMRFIYIYIYVCVYSMYVYAGTDTVCTSKIRPCEFAKDRGPEYNSQPVRLLLQGQPQKGPPMYKKKQLFLYSANGYGASVDWICQSLGTGGFPDLFPKGNIHLQGPCWLRRPEVTRTW